METKLSRTKNNEERNKKSLKDLIHLGWDVTRLALHWLISNSEC